MWKVTIEGIRCFKTRQEVPLAPLTLLVGENSTGKSTFLAVTRILWDLMASEVEPNFNEEPFDLGAFDNIANYTGGRKGRAKSFHIGVEFANGFGDETQDANIRLLATFGASRLFSGRPSDQGTIA
jgi:predicted ATPase